MLKKASNLFTHLLLYAWHLLLLQSFKTFSMTPLELYIKSLENQLLLMPDGFVKETVISCKELAEGINKMYENTYYNSCQSTDQD